MSRDPAGSVPPRRRKPSTPPGSEGATPAEEPTAWTPNPKAKAKASTTRPRSAALADAGPMPAGPGWWERILFGRASSGQLARFCRQFAAYLDAGVDVLKALTSLEEQFASTALGPVIGRLRTGVRQGDTLAELAAREPAAFDKLFVSMMKVAEMRGGVPEALKRLAHHYEARQSLIRQARSAMIYPITVLVVASGVVALITIWLLPMFIALLKDLGARGSLPFASRALMAFSDFIGKIGWWLIPLVMIGVPILAFRLYKTASGKRAMDEVAYHIPVLGLLLRKLDTTRFARTLSVLLGSGVDVGTSLDLTADVMQLDPFRRAVQGSKKIVLDGAELSEALGASGRFGPDVIAVVNSGEETGKLPETLDHLADDYEEQVAYMVKNMGQLVQPLILILMGGIVLFIILAVFLPYISILTNLAR